MSKCATLITGINQDGTLEVHCRECLHGDVTALTEYKYLRDVSVRVAVGKAPIRALQKLKIEIEAVQKLQNTFSAVASKSKSKFSLVKFLFGGKQSIRKDGNLP
jgi:hypothetical protein